MNRFADSWHRTGLRLKLQILIQGFLVVVLGAAQVWVSTQFERQVISGAESRARAVADGAVNGLNTLMVTKLGGDDVISDKAARALFIKKMGEGDKIQELRIVRAKAIDDEFPAGLPQEQPADEFDRRVLASGRRLHDPGRVGEVPDGAANP
jgi:methyl-accepting chemotaxis protein